MPSEFELKAYKIADDFLEELKNGVTKSNNHFFHLGGEGNLAKNLMCQHEIISYVVPTSKNSIIHLGKNAFKVFAANGIQNYLAKLEEEEKESKRRPIQQNVLKIGTNKGNAAIQPSASESPLSQSVTTTPNIKDAPDKTIWYKTTLFTKVVFPILTAVITAVILYLIFRQPPK